MKHFVKDIQGMDIARGKTHFQNGRYQWRRDIYKTKNQMCCVEFCKEEEDTEFTLHKPGYYSRFSHTGRRVKRVSQTTPQSNVPGINFMMVASKLLCCSGASCSTE
ncbi:uncharacterized protein LOC143241819 isoform X3 [Tachypleus tridentatus]|uniref:uncharacterized protein LOC143241819 isoform X3 n=1 Tax=Tachypleus tridentatus TaxID=6853 RepID=UPI003FD04FC9